MLKVMIRRLFQASSINVIGNLIIVIQGTINGCDLGEFFPIILRSVLKYLASSINVIGTLL